MFVMLLQVGTPYPTPDYDEIAAKLRQRGHTVWVATPDEGGDLLFDNGETCVAALAMPRRVKPRRSSMWPLRRIGVMRENWDFIKRLRTFIRQMQPDVVQINQARMPFLWAIPLGLDGGTRFVVDWRQIAEREFSGPFAGLRRAWHLQKRRFPSRHIYDHACFLHAAGAERLLGDQWEKWGSVVPLAVNPRFLSVDARSTPTMPETGLPVRFIYIGSLSRVRKLERLLLAAHEIHAQMNGASDFRLTFVGPDKSEGYYGSLVQSLELDGLVEICPPVPYESVPDLLLAADVALAYIPETPLDWHYHPTLKVLEYRAIGVPIIATDLEPNRAVVVDGKNGLLVPNSVEGLAEAMRRFAQDAQFREECTLGARSMREGLLWDDVALIYEELYVRLIEAG